ncbi:hypothetical protein BT96DRAFT_748351, partial [Gymnopus androsaceus JB14]
KQLTPSTKLLPAWKETIVSLSLTPKQIPRDIKTCWNSTFDLLNMALHYRPAIVQHVADHQEELAGCILSCLEWEIAFKDATLYFSCDSTMLATVIPAMDKLDSLLATSILKKKDSKVEFAVPMKIALLAAKDMLNRYYSHTDLTRVYHVAMSKIFV